MERYMETLGLGVAHADFNLIPVAAYATYEGTPKHVQAPSEPGHFLAQVRGIVQRLALELVHAWAWLARHHAAA